MIVLPAALGVAGRAEQAQAAPMSQFDPGYIISDTVFYNSSTMSAHGIQAFLDQKGSDCVPNATDGTACLKDYRQATADRAADPRCAGAYVGAPDESAATIVAKVAAACGINPRVLLVTLQKEQSLVTRRTSGTAAIYQKAMGFGCPDTAACDTKYYGFFNQVYSAASQFRNYALNPTRFGHRAGDVVAIRFHPNVACGSSPVLIRNQATASLYNYTPYQPNQAALAAGYGTGDSCSSYGNRNFWAYFTDWWGSTISPDPIGFLDSATAAEGRAIRVSGWALDPDTTASVVIHLYVDGQPTGVVADRPRPDIAAAYPNWGEKHGFSADLPVAEGPHRVCAYAINQPVGFNPPLGCRDVSVVNTAPIGMLDVAAATPSTVSVAGWAWDVDTSTPVPVHVYIDGRHAGTVLAEGARPDVAAVFPAAGGARGYAWEGAVAAGTHEVCVWAINDPVSSNPRLGCRQVVVVNATPTGFVDQVLGGSGVISASGWVWDADAGAPSGVHVYVDGMYGGATQTGVARPDVAAALPGFGGQTGFSLQIPAAVGTHRVCFFAINGPLGHNPPLGCFSTAVG